MVCRHQAARCPAPWEAGRQGDGQTSARFAASGSGCKAQALLPPPHTRAAQSLAELGRQGVPRETSSPRGLGAFLGAGAGCYPSHPGQFLCSRFPKEAAHEEGTCRSPLQIKGGLFLATLEGPAVTGCGSCARTYDGEKARASL